METMQDVYTQLKDQRELLTKCIEYLKDRNRNLAKAEYDYRLALTKECLKLKIEGYEGELGKTEQVAWTKADLIAKGMDHVAELRLKRDLAKGDVEATMQKIYAVKIEIGILERDMEAIRKGE